MLEDGFLTDGYSFGDLPDSITDNIADDEAVRQYKQEINQIRHDIEKAKSVGDNITTVQLEQDLQNLTSKINEIISPAGQRKKYPDQVNNIVTSFRNAVNYTIDKIDEHDEELARHFKCSIKFGRVPKYFTEGNFNWHI
jgi:chromosome segregation ATPase